MSALARLWGALTGRPAAAAATMPPAPSDTLGAATLPVAAVGDAPPKPVVLDMGVLLPSALHLTALGWTRSGEWAAAMAGPCRTYGINTRLRLAAFLANIGHETGGGARLVESVNYTVEALLTTFGRHRISEEQARRLGRKYGRQADQRAIANTIYGGEWGRKNLGNTMPDDGWRFRGRGLMQLTGRANYVRFARLAGVPLDDALLMALEMPEGAAKSAAHFWSVAGCNDPADKGDIARVRRIVNGGDIGLDDVRVRYAKALGVLPT